MSAPTAVTNSARFLRRATQAVLPLASKAKIKPILLADAEVLVRWLNATRHLGAECSRISDLYSQLAELRSGHTRLQKLLKGLRAGVGKRARPRLTPAQAEYEREYRNLESKTEKVNQTLARYVFRPAVGYTVITETRSGGLTPDVAEWMFRSTVGEWELLEADAAMSAVRLYLSGELARVHLCDFCRSEWHVRAKSHYRYHSEECRNSAYAQSPQYLARKRANQKRYRQTVKLAEQHALQQVRLLPRGRG